MSETIIPKIIHYCWFGRNPLPKTAQKCIRSWKKFFPDYEIIQWNEDNYDINKILYTKQAYEAKKYAFVSDYARFDILYHKGGLYFDTDVEVIKSFDDIILNNGFMGCEIDGIVSIKTAPGLGIAAVPGLRLYEEILDYYRTQKFIDENDNINTETVVTKTTKILKQHGLKDITGIQVVDGITIYPKEYLNPMNNNTGKLEITTNTHSIHWYSMSWITPMGRLKSKVTRLFHRIWGENCFGTLKNKINMRGVGER